MIRIDTSKIEKWEEIKERHSEWGKKHIKEQVEFLRDFLKDKLSVVDYEKEIGFYDTYILKNLESIILSEKIKEEIIDSSNKKYTELVKELKNRIDFEFCKEGIEILKGEINKSNKVEILKKIDEYFVKHKENDFIYNLECKYQKLKNEKYIKNMKVIIIELKSEF